MLGVGVESRNMTLCVIFNEHDILAGKTELAIDICVAKLRVGIPLMPSFKLTSLNSHCIILQF